ncbi:MAG: hypothetical protein NTZ21_09740 [Actinobacteria bacterium]|nr:hypothetical protein [Actinomycetota bacterium]
MPNIDLRDVPDALHKELSIRAAIAGRTLEAYVVDLLNREVSPMIEPMPLRPRRRTGVHLDVDEVVRLVRADRDGGIA